MKKGRPKEPNSQRSLMEKRKEAELLAKEQAERAAQLAKELEENQKKYEARIAELESQQAAIAAAKEQAERELSEKIEEETPMALSDEEQNDLLEILNGALTKEKNPQVEAKEEPKVVESDFDGDFEEAEAEPEIIKESSQEGKVFVGIPPKEFAGIIIDGLDVFMQYTAPLSYQKIAFSTEEMKRLRGIQQQAKIKSKKELVLEDDDYDLLARMEEFMEYKKTVELSDAEKKSLRIPLEVMLKQKGGGDLPPGWAFAYAATMVALPRFAPHISIVLAKQFSKPPIIPQDEEN